MQQEEVSARFSPKAPDRKIPPHLKQPRPEDFGLPPRTTAASCRWDICLVEGQYKYRTIAITYLLAFVVLTGIVTFLAHKPSQLLFDWSDKRTYVRMGCVAFLALFVRYMFEDRVALHFKRKADAQVDPNMRAFVAADAAFEAQLADWKDRQTEGGMTYWREQRGVAFEQALAKFFTRRACKVQTTKGSGDGGIDLILHIGSETFWCQCKGHASAIGVPVIREIAGVCSRGGGKPVVIAVNGFTKSAMATADELGVLLIDSHHLVRLASKSDLISWT